MGRYRQNMFTKVWGIWKKDKKVGVGHLGGVQTPGI